MKNYFLMSILLVVACVCASCEPNSEEPINYQEGEVSQVELSIEDTIKTVQNSRRELK